MLATRIGLTSLLCIALLQLSSVSAQSPVEFNRDVRPILSDKCFACHGPDSKTRKADLRLDQRESATSDLGGYQAIVPGKSAESELMRRVLSSDGDESMPPPEHEKPLTKQEIEILRMWIDQGGEYQEHWSLVPLVRPEVPKSVGKGNAIDAFINQRLEKVGFSQNPQADPRTLARRLSFDLIGLPPDAQLVAGFTQNPGDDEYAKLVESLLASPHYGERMAIYWLDLVRYADTLGYHGDQVRSVSPYRDYVIRAFNDNVPFDQFTVEQLAGDLLPEATLWQKVASTYNRLNRASAEGGVQPKEYLAKYSADRVRTTASVWLGSTLGCAECHDHKFDAFTTKDFYRFAAFFADIQEQGIVNGANYVALLPVPTEEQAAKQLELASNIATAQTEFDRETDDVVKARAEWEATIRSAEDRWTLLTPKEAKSAGGATLTIKEDQSILASEKSPDKDTYDVTLVTANEKAIAEIASTENLTVAIRIELLPDDSLPAKGPGRAGNGNVVVNRIDATIGGRPIKWDSASSSHDQGGFPAVNVLKEPYKGWAILPQIGKSQQLILAGKIEKEKEASDKAIDKATAENNSIRLRIAQNHGTNHNIGRFRVYVATSTTDLKADAFGANEITELVKIEPTKRSSEQLKKLDVEFRKQTPLLAEVRKRLEQLRNEETALKNSIITTLGTSATTPREIRVLPRGDWMSDAGEVVAPGVPGFLPQPTTEEGDRLSRLDLAKWMVARENPLVARTFVNRLWMLMFGNGLSRSVDDLGSQGEPPTHPELLDWLAIEFVESGWDVKHIVRLMVTSQTYRQSSAVSKKMREVDPYNKLYARQSRWRLDAEMVRDNALQLSGLLVNEIGGKSVMPYQPAGYWDQLNFPKRTYQQDSGTNQYRRGLYTHWQRTFLHPSLMAFDATAREECTARRDRSNTPLQSLVLLNDPTYVESARVLAARVMQESDGDFDQRLNWLLNESLGRPPYEAERSLLRAMYERNLAIYRESPQDADKLLATGLAKVPENVDRKDLAAWTSVTRAILNLHETIMRY